MDCGGGGGGGGRNGQVGRVVEGLSALLAAVRNVGLKPSIQYPGVSNSMKSTEKEPFTAV